MSSTPEIISLVEYLKEDVLLDEVVITKEQAKQLLKVMTATCEALGYIDEQNETD